ncbi:GDP-mannose pyrophosphatase NudK [Pedobacter sp.]|jgi:GDP-mannose pyrophosphatase NudK|uniref:GDP-mannose pyrophosphatase NudK n=1 Tax=Pedobacter sp. TaxID=1411316 RepID=UPI002D05ECC4|nr:GDP-mannose pyrophosphatase NudK [Pedobacter sp.]HWW41267.1 GDP-mannose pyrophosphatase NudK [Pedobacter sp.]
MNERINIIKEQVLSDDWYLLKKTTFNYLTNKGNWENRSRETYDRGNGATLLLYNKLSRTVVLTRQFRFPTYVNGNPDGLLIETCAGLLDNDGPEEAIRREVEEETGYVLSSVEKVFEAYMSPGSVTEKVYFFIAEYTKDMKKYLGGGVEDEEIEVLELSFEEAMAMISNGQIQDGKTIMLLQYLSLSKLMN